MLSGMKHMIFKAHFVVSIQSLSKMMSIPATTTWLGVLCDFNKCPTYKIIGLLDLYHLPFWQAFKAFITFYYIHNLSFQATNDDAFTINLVIILMETMLLNLFV
jgi:hypothetical protein